MKHIKKEKYKKCFRLQASDFRNKGFTLIEILVSAGIISIVLVGIVSFVILMNNYNLKTKADKDVEDNSRMVLNAIIYEIKGAKSIYTPTTTSNQLSLETSKYLPTDETTTFIDFFICGSAICLKKESQNPVSLTSNSVKVTTLLFSQISNNGEPSVQINLTVNSNDPSSSSSVNLTSTASLRSY